MLTTPFSSEPLQTPANIEINQPTPQMLSPSPKTTTQINSKYIKSMHYSDYNQTAFTNFACKNRNEEKSEEAEIPSMIAGSAPENAPQIATEEENMQQSGIGHQQINIIHPTNMCQNNMQPQVCSGSDPTVTKAPTLPTSTRSSLINQQYSHPDELLSRIIKDYDKRFKHLKSLLHNTERNANAIKKIVSPLIPNTNCLVKKCHMSTHTSLCDTESISNQLSSKSSSGSESLKTGASASKPINVQNGNKETDLLKQHIKIRNTSHVSPGQSLTPSFVIWGQSYKAKSELAAKILGKYILPHDTPNLPIRINAGPRMKIEQKNSYVFLDHFESVLSRPNTLDVDNRGSFQPDAKTKKGRLRSSFNFFGQKDRSNSQAVANIPSSIDSDDYYDENDGLPGHAHHSFNPIRFLTRSPRKHRRQLNSRSSGSLETNFDNDITISDTEEQDKRPFSIEGQANAFDSIESSSNNSNYKERMEQMIHTAPVDLCVDHPLLTAGWQMLIAPSDAGKKYSHQEVLSFCVDSVTPFVLYALDQGRLTKREMSELVIVRKLMPNTAICFVEICDNPKQGKDTNVSSQLIELGFLEKQRHKSQCEHPTLNANSQTSTGTCMCSNCVENNHVYDWINVSGRTQLIDVKNFQIPVNFNQRLLQYVRRQARSYLADNVQTLLSHHRHLFQQLIYASYSAQQDKILAPRRFQWARDQEISLYNFTCKKLKDKSTYETLEHFFHEIKKDLIDNNFYEELRAESQHNSLTSSTISVDNTEKLLNKSKIDQCFFSTQDNSKNLRLPAESHIQKSTTKLVIEALCGKLKKIIHYNCSDVLLRLIHRLENGDHGKQSSSGNSGTGSNINTPGTSEFMNDFFGTKLSQKGQTKNNQGHKEGSDSLLAFEEEHPTSMISNSNISLNSTFLQPCVNSSAFDNLDLDKSSSHSIAKIEVFSKSDVKKTLAGYLYLLKNAVNYSVEEIPSSSIFDYYKRFFNSIKRTFSSKKTPQAVVSNLIRTEGFTNSFSSSKSSKSVGSLAWYSSAKNYDEKIFEARMKVLDMINEEKLIHSILDIVLQTSDEAHEGFHDVIDDLEDCYLSKREKLEKTRKQVCRDAAPRVARLAMESRAFLDTLCNGTPKLEREIGRGK